MLKKILPILFVGLFITACEAPMDDSTTNGSNNGAATEGANSNGYNNGNSVGSQDQGAGEGELAPGVHDTIYFAADSSSIDGEAQRILSKQAEWIKTSGSHVLVEGHCDERGTREYNLALGERRANSIKQYLIAQGVQAGNIDTISYGKERPIADGHDESAWQRNRRGVTVKK